MIDGFYRAFEDKHRGTLALIKERQRAYLPLIKPLIEIYPRASAIDLGCGRGEWLELLVETGFEPHGIDLDDGMLAECRARGLNVQTQDALTALKALPDNSQAIVSGFHFAEHIPFAVLQEVVQQAHRVLMPAGLLILETPNPENIVVGTANFYLDPSHNRPLPPLLMEFLPEYYGFHRTKILRLQEPINLNDARKFSIHDVLGGVSPDYAVVAQKAAEAATLRRVSHAFDADFGVTLGMISSRYEDQQAQVQHQFNVLVQEVDKAHDRRMLELERRMLAAEEHLHRIEAGRFVAFCKRLIKKVGRPLFLKAKAYLATHPTAHARMVQVAQKVGVYRVLHIVLNKGTGTATLNRNMNTQKSDVEGILIDQPREVRSMYGELDRAIKKTEKQ